mgnify:CR=1 FL=1
MTTTTNIKSAVVAAGLAASLMMGGAGPSLADEVTLRMAVPDWPTTYGYNLFLYPWQTWLLGPWDLFIEHGHRLLAATVGMLTIALMVLLWRTDSRRWMKVLGAAALRDHEKSRS